MTAERSAWTAGAVAFGATPAAPATPDTTLASRASGIGGAKANARSLDAVMSADGRRGAFASDATNLSADDDPLATDVLVRDLDAPTATLASRATNPDTHYDPYARELAAPHSVPTLPAQTHGAR